MKKFLFILCMMMLSMGAVAFADDGMVFASDSTYVAIIMPNSSLVDLTANRNASVTATLDNFTFVTSIDASIDIFKASAASLALSSATFAQKIDYAAGPLEVYITPTFNFVDVFAITLPAAVVVAVAPFATITVEYDFMGFTDNLSPITITAEVAF